MNRVGRRNLITDVPGVMVGNAQDATACTGVSVVLPEEAAVAAADIRGGGTGTRELALLDPEATVERVDAIVLSGGSAFGLDAAGGVMAWLAARRRGVEVGTAVVPIVPAAILFDLLNGGDKDWGDTPPYRALGTRAVEAAGTGFALGNAGAGYGAHTGLLKGGLGSASVVHDSGITVGAIAAVNSLGSVVMPKSLTFWGWAFERDGELGFQSPPPPDLPRDLEYRFDADPGVNTTLAVVATDAELTKSQARRVTIMAQDGLARAIRPVHSPLDGDVVFALSTGRRPLGDALADVARIGMMAADCVTRAVARGVYEAETLGTMQAYRDAARAPR